jgi:hypothetical protein
MKLKPVMIVYQPWVEFGGSDGEIVTHSYTLHSRQSTAIIHLDEIVKSLNDVVILNKGINKIQVLE